MSDDVQMEKEIREKTGVAPLSRIKELVKKFITDLDLDLSHLVVLTEAASGNYIFTPLVAALANAEKVIAVTKDSKYGKAKDVTENTLLLANYFDVDEKIQVFDVLKPTMIEKADIVTNLGFLRPINKGFILHLKPTAVIPLMYETWEFRKQDLDLRECWKKGIPVLGTNEEHEALRIFDYIGHLCLKKLYEAEIEVFRSRIVLVGDNKFGKNIIKTLSTVGAEVLCVTKAEEEEVRQLGGTKIGDSLREFNVQDKIRSCEAIIINTYPKFDVIIGENGEISAKRLRALAPRTTIIQLNGQVDRKSLDEYGFVCLPKEEPKVGHMGWTLADLGPKPLIALHGGGLKVGELLARARLKGLDRVRAEREALKHDICQDFSPTQRRKYKHARIFRM